MGHYRSEMSYEDRDRKNAEDKAARRKRSAQLIDEAIEARGIAEVLAEMIEDPLMFKIRYR